MRVRIAGLTCLLLLATLAFPAAAQQSQAPLREPDVIFVPTPEGGVAVGIDIDPERIAESNANAKEAGVTDKVKFILGDLFEADIKEATVVTLYLLTSLNQKLRPKLWRELKPGTRIVSHAFDMGDWQPEKTEDVDGRKIYFWTIPKDAAARAAASKN
jgi:hypothetical protein